MIDSPPFLRSLRHESRRKRIDVCPIEPYRQAVAVASAWEATPRVGFGMVPPQRVWRALALIEAYRDGIEPEAVMGRVRSHAFCVPRHRAWRRLREHGYSLPGIGMAVNRDHTSILAALRKMENAP